tara:strand:+ start:11600 stop:12004 length:405 start_codon:yes stop_codon:yes gene_type:complete
VKLIEFDKEAKRSRSNNNFRGERTVLKESLSLPIDASSSSWEVLRNPERIAKTFRFDDFRKMYDFISDILVYQEKIRHHAVITIDHFNVTIESTTRDLNSVTELDKNIADYTDLVYEDVFYYYAADNVDNEKFQ